MIVRLALPSQYLWWEDKSISIHESVDSCNSCKSWFINFPYNFCMCLNFLY